MAAEPAKPPLASAEDRRHSRRSSRPGPARSPPPTSETGWGSNTYPELPSTHSDQIGATDLRTALLTRPKPGFENYWLPNPDNWQNSVHRFLFWLPEPLIATETAIPPASPPARKGVVELALEFQRLLDEGVVDTRADTARRYGVSRARVTQVLNVLQLPEPVLRFLAELPPDSGSFYTERRLRPILNLPSEATQVEAVLRLRSQTETGQS